MANGQPPPGGGGTFKGMPKWVWFAGGGVLLVGGFFYYRARKNAQAAQAANTSGYTGGAQAGAYGSPLPGAGVLDPILLQQPISVNIPGGAGGCPCGTQPSGISSTGTSPNWGPGGGPGGNNSVCAPCSTTKQIRIQNPPGPMTPADWAALTAQPNDVQNYLRGLAAQVQKTGGWTQVPNTFPVPANATMTGSGPGYVTYIPAPPPNSPAVTAAI